MAFPDDILRIISDFSKPYFKYFREYNRALRLHGFMQWPQLKHALLTNAPLVLLALNRYEEALALFQLYDAQHRIWFLSHSDEEERHLRSLESIRKKFDLFSKREELNYLVKFGRTL